MKKCLLLFLLAAALNFESNAQATYYWAGGNTGTLAWNAAANWSTTPGGGGTTRVAPDPGDVLVFDGANLGGGATGALTVNNLVTETIAQLKFINNANVTLGHSSTRTITIAGSAGIDFIIGNGASLTVGFTSNTSNITFLFGSGTNGSIAGTLTFQLGAHRLTPATEAECIVFESTSIFNHNSTGSSAFNGATAAPTNNNVLFKNGSAFHLGGGSTSLPFTASAPASVVKFEDESNFYFNTSTASASSGRTYGNVIINANVTTLTAAVVLNNLTVNSGFTLTLPNSTNRWNIKGSITVNGTIVNAAGSNYPDFNMIGTGALQTINFNTENIKMRSFAVGTDANVLLANGFQVNTASPQQNIYGVLNMAGKVIDGNSVGSVVIRTANIVNATLTSPVSANSNTIVSTSAAGVSNGMLVTSPVHPPNTYVINTSSGTFTLSNYSTGTMAVGETVVISQGSGTIKTSNPGGLNAALPAFAAYDMKGNYEFNAVTTTPFPSAAGTVNAQDITTNASVTLNKTVNVFDVLTVNSGVLTTTGGSLTLKSDATGTARLAPVTGSIVGDVTVERYIPASGRRAWRLLGTSINAATAPTVKEAWQEGGAAASTTGTHITQAGGAGASGFDASSIAGAHSIRYYNGAALQNPPNTDVTKITDNGGAYFLFVRGNRTIDLDNASSNSNTTLRQTGALNQGTVVTNAITGAFTLIPNPYPSAVDYEAIVTDVANVALVTGQYYIWDANMGAVGAYRTIQRTGAGTYSSTPTTGDDNTMRYIRSGQAFFIPVASQVTFKESMKTAMLPTTNVYRAGAGTEEMTIDLKVVDSNANAVLYDGVRATYNNGYAAAVDMNDLPKLNNFNENLAIARDNKNMSVELRPLVDAADTIFLKLWNTGIKNYRFDINPANFSASANIEALLVDGYLNTTTPVSLSANTLYDFSVTSDAASANADRFMIVFRAASPLPVSFTNIKAYKKDAGIQVEWNVASEEGVVRYEVEKSLNGVAFDKAGSVTAASSKSYNWFDANPVAGANFYRVKVIEKDNSFHYSSVVSVKMDVTKGDIAVYPNPVKGSVINVQFTNQEKGTYSVQLFNNVGQQVFAGSIKHAGGSLNQPLTVGKAMTKGVYQLAITSGDRKLTQQVIVE